jgi:hypothetical protein
MVGCIAKRLRALCAAAGLAVALTSCLPFPPGDVMVIEMAPPAPRVEMMGMGPGPGYVWVGGFWSWRDGRFGWVVGQWMVVPPGHYYWVPGHWVRTRRGWYFVNGYWD